MNSTPGNPLEATSDPARPGHFTVAVAPGSTWVTPVRLLEFDRPYWYPWLTPALAQQEIAIEEHAQDTEALFMDSLA